MVGSRGYVARVGALTTEDGADHEDVPVLLERFEGGGNRLTTCQCQNPCLGDGLTGDSKFMTFEGRRNGTLDDIFPEQNVPLRVIW